MAKYPIIDQRSLPKASRRGPKGLLPPRRSADELPLPNPHEVVVYKSGGRYVVDDGRSPVGDDHVTNATSISVVDMRENAPVSVETTIPSAGAAEFTVQVTFLCTVRKPVEIVESGLQDIRSPLTNYLIQHQELFRLGQDYHMDQVAKVRNSVTAEVRAYFNVRPARFQGLDVRLGNVLVLTPVELRDKQRTRELERLLTSEQQEVGHALAQQKADLDEMRRVSEEKFELERRRHQQALAQMQQDMTRMDEQFQQQDVHYQQDLARENARREYALEIERLKLQAEVVVAAVNRGLADHQNIEYLLSELKTVTRQLEQVAGAPPLAEEGHGQERLAAAPRAEPGGDEVDGPPTRYLTGTLPERASTGRPISLQVQITMSAPTGPSTTLRPLAVPPAGKTVTLIVTAPGLESHGDLEQDVRVPATGDSDPVRFRFTTGRAGLHLVKVRAFAGGTFLAELGLQVSVEVGAVFEEGAPQSAVMDGLAAEPGEVTLQVNLDDEGRYSFQLIGEALYPIELTRRLAGDPAKIVQTLGEELRAMAEMGAPYANPRLVRERIRSLGAQLWADVVPHSIRRQFWEQADRIKLFTVASDMDMIPWELLYPIDNEKDNGFLVDQFPVVRRVYGQGRARRLPLTSAAFVVPPESPTNAMEEVEAVRARLGGQIEHEIVCTKLESLRGLLNAPPSVLHFACHNNFHENAGSVIRLGGGPLYPSDLTPAKLSRSMAEVSPLIFMNACRSASEIPGLMQMMGWAKQFMGAGAGAFVGSLWAIRSKSALDFADAFYRALVVDGQPLGVASHQARQAIAGDEGDPTWLAYTVYGNPAATIQ